MGCSSSRDMIDKYVNIQTHTDDVAMPKYLQGVDTARRQSTYFFYDDNDDGDDLKDEADNTNIGLFGSWDNIIPIFSGWMPAENKAPVNELETATAASVCTVEYTGLKNEKGEPEGEGVMVYSNGSRYEGQWQHGQRNGLGKYVSTRGKVYEGTFVDGNLTGCGKLSYSNGNFYEGNFSNGIVSGQGKFTFGGGTRKGEVYSGTFLDGRCHGEGVLSYPDGKRYEGLFMNGKRHGRGKLYSADGTIEYDGEWSNGERTQELFGFQLLP